MKHLVERFLRYVTFDTQSNPHVTLCPSSPGQLVFAELLKKEMIELGLSDVTLDKNGYLMAKLPANIDYEVPPIGFIAIWIPRRMHLQKRKAAIHRRYQGGDIALGLGDEVLSPVQYPDLHHLHGHNLITTDGTTLLGADNKAGIAEILSAVALLLENPDIPHGDICIGFTPDEEIGRGADLFNVKKNLARNGHTL